MLRGSTEIMKTACDHLGGIKPGETTKNGKFTVIEVECQGACSNAPMMVVGDDFYVRWLSYAHLINDLRPFVGGPDSRVNKESAGRLLQGQKT